MAVGTQSFGGSNVICPDWAKPPVPSVSVGSTFQAVALPEASMAVAYSSAPLQPLRPPRTKLRLISRNISVLPIITDSPVPPKFSSESASWACEVTWRQLPSEPTCTFQNHATGHDEALSPVNGCACVTWKKA